MTLNEQKTERLQALAEIIAAVSEASLVNVEIPMLPTGSKRKEPVLHPKMAIDLCEKAAREAADLLNQDEFWNER